MLKIHHFESFQTRSKLENKIENFFKEISKLRNREIVKILKNDFEIVTAYLNTGLDVSIDITDIAEKYYKKS